MCRRCFEQQSRTATPPSIAIEALELGGRVCAVCVSQPIVIIHRLQEVNSKTFVQGEALGRTAVCDPCLLERQLGWSRVWHHEEPPTAEVSRSHLGGESFLVTSLARVTRSEHDLQKAFQGQNLKNPTIGCLGSREFPSPVSSVHTRSNLSGWSSRCKGLQRLIGSTDRCQILRYVWYDT